MLKEVTMLRGIELLSSLQNITKPFYLNNLTREQSEDLGRAGQFQFHFQFLFRFLFLSYEHFVCFWIYVDYCPSYILAKLQKPLIF